MKTINEQMMRSVNGGATVSASEKCSVCGKKYSSKITYYWYQVFKVSLYKSTVKANAHKKALECAMRDLGY